MLTLLLDYPDFQFKGSQNIYQINSGNAVEGQSFDAFADMEILLMYILINTK